MARNKVEFKATIKRAVFVSDTFKVYAAKVDRNLYPFIKLSKYNDVSINGDIPTLIEGIEYEITAIEETGKYGVGYRVSYIRRNVPTAKNDVKKFLTEVLTPNQAETLYENYPDIIDIVKENRVNEIDLSKLNGIGEKTLPKIVKKIEESFHLTDIVAEFGGILSFNIIKKLYDKFTSVSKIKKKLTEEPYSALTSVSGIGFKTADQIIIKLQDEGLLTFNQDIKKSIDRCISCILYILSKNEEEGHTKMNLAELRKQCYELVPACANHFPIAIQSNDVYYDKENMEAALFSTYKTEEYIAETICRYVNNSNVWNCDVEKYRNIGEFTLSDEQIKIVENVCKHNICILNGAAGVGKSQSTLAIINMLDDLEKTYKLFAPTGKSAKVLKDFTGKEASTIHRGLGYAPKGGWVYNKKSKLYADIVIVDEFSMVDVGLFGHLIDAIDFNITKLLIIGDNSQLPSVGCGNLLHDFMQSNIIPTVTLTKVFRYGEGGLMKVATDIRNCSHYLNNSMRNVTTAFGDNGDYVFIDTKQESIPGKALGIYKKLLPQVGMANVQVLTAKNIGDYGTVKMNQMLQKIANENYGKGVSIAMGDVTYYVGDLVMQCKNKYDADIFEEERSYDPYRDNTAFVANGETGIITNIVKDRFDSRECVYILFDDITVKYYREDMKDVKLAYAITCHKAQGSSIENVIFLTPKADTFMLNSNLLYVGITRTRKRCFHIGVLDTVNKVINKKENFSRNTFMQDMLEKKKCEENVCDF